MKINKLLFILKVNAIVLSYISRSRIIYHKLLSFKMKWMNKMWIFIIYLFIMIIFLFVFSSHLSLLIDFGRNYITDLQILNFIWDRRAPVGLNLTVNRFSLNPLGGTRKSKYLNTKYSIYIYKYTYYLFIYIILFHPSIILNWNNI